MFAAQIDRPAGRLLASPPPSIPPRRPIPACCWCSPNWSPACCSSPRDWTARSLEIFARSLETHPPGSFRARRGRWQSRDRVRRRDAFRRPAAGAAGDRVAACWWIFAGAAGPAQRATATADAWRFPVKMLAALVLLAWLTAVLPAIYRSACRPRCGALLAGAGPSCMADRSQKTEKPTPRGAWRRRARKATFPPPSEFVGAHAVPGVRALLHRLGRRCLDRADARASCGCCWQRAFAGRA